MPILDNPKLIYMPSFIEALHEGFTMGAQAPKTNQEISEIEKDPAKFISNCTVKPSPFYMTPAHEKVERPPQEDWWYVDGDIFIGRINAKHFLNAHQLNDAGHIGYAVRPSERGKGHATKMLQLVLDYYRENHDMNQVLLTCETANIISAKVIEKCGGIFEDIRTRPHDGREFKRYWINL